MEHFDFINPLADLKTDLNDPEWKDFYSVADRSSEAKRRFERNWVAKNIELIDKYQLDSLWWDNGANRRNYDPLKLEVFAYFYNQAAEWGKEVTMVTKGDTLYAIAMAWPGEQLVVTSLATGQALAGKIEKVELLGHSGNLPYTQDAEGLKVKFPAEKPCDYAYALKITGLRPKP